MCARCEKQRIKFQLVKMSDLKYSSEGDVLVTFRRPVILDVRLYADAYV